MTGFQAPGKPHWVCWDGQSHNVTVGEGSSPFTLPWRAMAGRVVPWSVPAVAGTAWTTLATTVSTRRNPYVGVSTKTHLIMIGSTQDILNGDSAATILASEKSYAVSARAAGFFSVTNTTTFPAVPFTGPQEAVRVSLNSSKMADVSGDFTSVVDLAGVAGLNDPTSDHYFVDQTHLSVKGLNLAAATLASTLNGLLV